MKGGNLAVGDGLDQIEATFAPQAGNDVGGRIAPRIQGGIATYTVTLIFSLSTFALFWSPRARTSTAVRAEGLIEVVGHWHRDKLELREDAPVFPSAQWRALAKFFLRKSKVQTTIISTAAALRARRSRKFLAIAPGPAIRSSLRIELGKGGPRG